MFFKDMYKAISGKSITNTYMNSILSIIINNYKT